MYCEKHKRPLFECEMFDTSCLVCGCGSECESGCSMPKKVKFGYHCSKCDWTFVAEVVIDKCPDCNEPETRLDEHEQTV